MFCNEIQEDLYYPHTIIQDFLWDGLHYLSEPLFKYLPVTKLREKALKRTLELTRYNAEESRYITMASVEKTLNPSEMFADIVVEREESVLQTHLLSEILCILSRGGTLSGLSNRLNLFGSNWKTPNGKTVHGKIMTYETNRYGYRGICFIYGTFFSLGGLESAGLTYKNCEAIRKGVRFLLSTQNEEGGWDESYKSCPSEIYTPLAGNSD
ncbi:squalene cyclase [Artemisia annua]|uniref:Squalene cyclase n=1 Tax=Artemisia annua TaxID=35608 RepID=A0A2U1PE78_ARTAN|nr:squalene cyclase [Artemisia annua]